MKLIMRELLVRQGQLEGYDTGVLKGMCVYPVGGFRHIKFYHISWPAITEGSIKSIKKTELLSFIDSTFGIITAFDILLKT